MILLPAVTGGFEGRDRARRSVSVGRGVNRALQRASVSVGVNGALQTPLQAWCATVTGGATPPPPPH